jgi:prolyl-tRNA synthetase
MRYSQFYAPTQKTIAAADSINASLLVRAGFVNQVAAGVYNYLPSGLRVIEKIQSVVRVEMAKLGASEVLFSALQPQKTWEQSGRWADKNFRQIIYQDERAQMTFGATHEEPMVIATKNAIQSYRDLPVLLYQFQTKFRHELRPKSGLLRGREFRMKDLYSFHPDKKSHEQFYELCAKAYQTIFSQLGLTAYRVKAGGGVFTDELTDEFQVICPTGEDEIFVNHQIKAGYNREVESEIPKADREKLEPVRAIEVGNIFHLGDKYTRAFGAQYLDRDGRLRPIVMGSYGIGISRLLGTLAELYHDEHGLQWPRSVSPFDVYLIDLTDSSVGSKLEKTLEKAGFSVLYDDRDQPAGVKLVDADLIGLPARVVYSARTAQNGQVELKSRQNGKITLVKTDELPKQLSKLLG